MLFWDTDHAMCLEAFDKYSLLYVIYTPAILPYTCRWLTLEKRATRSAAVNGFSAIQVVIAIEPKTYSTPRANHIVTSKLVRTI